MAKGNIEIIKNAGPTLQYRVDDRTTSSATATIKQGEPVKVSGNFVVLVATAEPTNAAPMLGIAANESTETSTVDGVVDVTGIIPGSTVLRAKVTTPGNMDTDAELLGILNDTVTFTLSNGEFTVNEDEGTDPNVHGLEIIGGNIDKGTVDFMVRSYAIEQGSST